MEVGPLLCGVKGMFQTRWTATEVCAALLCGQNAPSSVGWDVLQHCFVGRMLLAGWDGTCYSTVKWADAPSSVGWDM